MEDVQPRTGCEQDARRDQHGRGERGHHIPTASKRTQGQRQEHGDGHHPEDGKAERAQPVAAIQPVKFALHIEQHHARCIVLRQARFERMHVGHLAQRQHRVPAAQALRKQRLQLEAEAGPRQVLGGQRREAFRFLRIFYEVRERARAKRQTGSGIGQVALQCDRIGYGLLTRALCRGAGKIERRRIESREDATGL